MAIILPTMQTLDITGRFEICVLFQFAGQKCCTCIFEVRYNATPFLKVGLSLTACCNGIEVCNWPLISSRELQCQKFGENLRIHSRKDSHLQWIRAYLSVSLTKLYGENPWILEKFPLRIQMDSCTWQQVSDPGTAIHKQSTLQLLESKKLVRR